MAEEEEENKWTKVGYYDILGLETSATPEEIKKAYRKRAMQCHPDKGGDAEEFKRVGEAKQVLMDPETRNFYDMYGEDGVAFHKAWKEAKPNEMLRQMGAGGIACFCCTNTVCVFFLLWFPLLLCLKVANHEEWLWAVVFGPLWVLDTIVVLMLCVWPLLPVNVARGDPLSAIRWDWLAQAIFFVAFQIMIVVKLDGVDCSWLVVFVPLYAFQAVGTGVALYDCLPAQYTAASRVKMAGSTCGHVVWVLFVLLQQVLWWGLWLLIQMRMDRELEFSWWIVLSPAFAICGVWWYIATRTPVVLSNDQDEKAYEQAFSRWKFAVATILFLVAFLGAFLAEGTDGVTIWAVWAPVYTASGLFLIALCASSVSLCKSESQSEDGVDFGANDYEYEDDGTPRDTDPLNRGSPREESNV